MLQLHRRQLCLPPLRPPRMHSCGRSKAEDAHCSSMEVAWDIDALWMQRRVCVCWVALECALPISHTCQLAPLVSHCLRAVVPLALLPAAPLTAVLIRSPGPTAAAARHSSSCYRSRLACGAAVQAAAERRRGTQSYSTMQVSRVTVASVLELPGLADAGQRLIACVTQMGRCKTSDCSNRMHGAQWSVPEIAQ